MSLRAFLRDVVTQVYLMRGRKISPCNIDFHSKRQKDELQPRSCQQNIRVKLVFQRKIRQNGDLI